MAKERLERRLSDEEFKTAEPRKCGKCKCSDFAMESLRVIRIGFKLVDGVMVENSEKVIETSDMVDFVKCAKCGKEFTGADNDFYVGETCKVCGNIVDEVDSDGACTNCIVEATTVMQSMGAINLYKMLLEKANKAKAKSKIKEQEESVDEEEVEITEEDIDGCF